MQRKKFSAAAHVKTLTEELFCSFMASPQLRRKFKNHIFSSPGFRLMKLPRNDIYRDGPLDKEKKLRPTRAE